MNCPAPPVGSCYVGLLGPSVNGGGVNDTVGRIRARSNAEMMMSRGARDLPTDLGPWCVGFGSLAVEFVPGHCITRSPISRQRPAGLGFAELGTGWRGEPAL